MGFGFVLFQQFYQEHAFAAQTSLWTNGLVGVRPLLPDTHPLLSLLSDTSPPPSAASQPPGSRPPSLAHWHVLLCPLRAA